MANLVMVRIKRMGAQWASCGVPVSPPEDMKGRPQIKRLCPKLVPGQVIKVPSDHNLLNQEAVERVRSLMPDEFLRPWVFKDAESAAMANPSKSRLGVAAIATGLALADGAQRKGLAAMAEREENARRAMLDEHERISGRKFEQDPDPEDDDGEESDSERMDRELAEVEANPRNAMSRGERDELRRASRQQAEEPEEEPEHEEEPEEEPAPARRTRRARR